jgi:hypothetical protein
MHRELVAGTIRGVAGPTLYEAQDLGDIPLRAALPPGLVDLVVEDADD